MASLDDKLASLASQRAASNAHLEEHEKLYQANLNQVAEKGKDSKNAVRKPFGSANSLADDRMDIDEPVAGDSVKARNRKYVTNLFVDAG